jgi:hypothetical protein
MTADIYDYIASRHAELGGVPQPVEHMLDDAEKFEFHDVFNLDRHGLANAMKARGLIYRDGMISAPEPEPGEPIPPADVTAQFIAACGLIFTTAQSPVDTPDLIRRTGVTPPPRMTAALKRAGLHYIKGAGWWTAPQYTTPEGKLLSRRIPSERLAAAVAAFENHGWPLTGSDLERLTKGIVTQRWIDGYMRKPIAEFFSAGHGLGLYAPADQRSQKPFPITANVATMMIGNSDGRLLNNIEHTHAYKLALLLSRHDMATVKRSRTPIEKTAVSTVRVKLTAAGLAFLKSRIPSADKF